MRPSPPQGHLLRLAPPPLDRRPLPHHWRRQGGREAEEPPPRDGPPRARLHRLHLPLHPLPGRLRGLGLQRRGQAQVPLSRVIELIPPRYTQPLFTLERAVLYRVYSPPYHTVFVSGTAVYSAVLRKYSCQLPVRPETIPSFVIWETEKHQRMMRSVFVCGRI